MQLQLGSDISCSRDLEARAFVRLAASMVFPALFTALVLVVGSVYFLSNRKQLRAPGLRAAMAIIAVLIALVVLWLYRSRVGGG